MRRSLIFLAVLASSTASAQTFTNSGAFLGLLGTPAYTETFETVPFAKDALFSSFTLTGVTYSGLAGVPFANVIVASPGYTNFGAGLNPTTSSVLTANGDESFLLSFLTPRYAVGFDAYYNGLGPATTSFFNNAVLLGSITQTGAASLGFAGFVSTPSALITSVQFTSTAGGQLNTAIDNVRMFDVPVSGVPEPGEFALLLPGLVGVALVRGRKRA